MGDYHDHYLKKYELLLAELSLLRDMLKQATNT